MNKENGGRRPENLSSLFYKGELTELIIQGFLGLGLLAGGIVLLALRIAGWSIILGLPMVVISSVFIIYTYDGISSNNLKIKDHENSDDSQDNDTVTGRDNV